LRSLSTEGGQLAAMRCTGEAAVRPLAQQLFFAIAEARPAYAPAIHSTSQ
jgi:hypothetical protein